MADNNDTNDSSLVQITPTKVAKAPKVKQSLGQRLADGAQFVAG